MEWKNGAFGALFETLCHALRLSWQTETSSSNSNQAKKSWKHSEGVFPLHSNRNDERVPGFLMKRTQKSTLNIDPKEGRRNNKKKCKRETPTCVNRSKNEKRFYNIRLMHKMMIIIIFTQIYCHCSFFFASSTSTYFTIEILTFFSFQHTPARASNFRVELCLKVPFDWHKHTRGVLALKSFGSFIFGWGEIVVGIHSLNGQSFDFQIAVPLDRNNFLRNL